MPTAPASTIVTAIYERLAAMRQRSNEIEALIADPAVIGQVERYRTLLKEHGALRPVLALYAELERTDQELAGTREMAAEPDPEIAAMAAAELPALVAKQSKLFDDLQARLLTADPDDDRSAIVEIRAGTGGAEASLFVRDLYFMYQKNAEAHGYKLEVLSTHETEVEGFRELSFLVAGPGAFGHFKYEGGGHRVQRVPKTEAQGRIHTSLCTVAVLPEVEDVEVVIRTEDLNIDVFRSSGPGGQSVNTTDSAVRITHLPTGVVVTCQDEKSQLKNKAKAMKVLKSRLYEAQRAEQQAKEAASRLSQVGTGDRSEKIRTYNFPQNRVTDHRIGLTINNLDSILAGGIDPLIDALRRHEVELRVKALGEQG